MSCGLIIEGQPVNTGPFQPADGTNLKFTTVILNPQTVPTIMLFLIPSNPIPPNHGIVLYCSSPTDPSLWSFLGSVTQTSPSKLLRTGWDQSDVFLNEPSATLGISIEPMDIIANLREMNGAEDRIRNKAFGKRIAQDLFNFMSSFNTNSNTTFMTVPTSILERWITRFEDKFDRNPSFFLS